jgi:NADH-ubiquinone oxidoreductase chain 5
MVTAGIFLLIRFSFILEYCTYIKIIIVGIGAASTIFGAIAASVQNDIKSIIAYSTCSQLGYMVLVSGVSGYLISLYHLLNHGFFKALLFLSAGLIIHNFNDEQDIRKMGGLFYVYPLLYGFFLVGSFSLVGIPFMSGYYSKELLLEYCASIPFY